MAAWSSPNPAERLAEAHKLYDVEVDYPAALSAFREVASSEEASEEQRVEALLFAGFSLVAMDRMEESHEVLVKAFLQDPGLETPPYLSPKLSDAVQEARREVETLARVTEPSRDEPPEELGETDTEAIADFTETPMPATDLRDEPSTAPSVTTIGALAGGGAALVCAGVGTYLVVGARQTFKRGTEEPESFASHAHWIHERDLAKRNQRIGYALFGTAGLLAVGSVVLLALEPGEENRIAASATRDGFLVALRGSF